MIGFAGLSHLGIVSGITSASKGFNVIAYDPDRALCDRLTRGDLPVLEPGLPELLATSHGHIRFTSDPAALAACDVVYFSLDVPTDEENRSDLSGLRRLISETGAHVKAGGTLVVLSQVPPGFTRRLAADLRPLLNERNAELFYQVETLIFGRAVERALQPERYVVGCADPRAALSAPYVALLEAFGCPILKMRYESAELAKISINMFLVSSISTTNTLAEICEQMGAEWSEIAPALRLDKRIGQYAYLAPGLGLGGGNLGRDLATIDSLAREHGTEAGVVHAWLANSQRRKDWVLRKIHSEVMAQCSEPTIAVWGLAYKVDTTSAKNSPALALLNSLKGVSARAYDPHVRLNGGLLNVAQAESALDACRGADALAVMTPWPEFAAVNLAQVRQAMRGRVILDPFGLLGREACAEQGLQHFRLGSPLESAAHA